MGRRGRKGPDGGHLPAPERHERHRPSLTKRAGGADGRLRQPGRGDPQAGPRNDVSQRGGGPDQGRSAHVGRDRRPDQPPRAAVGRVRAAVGQLRRARRGRDRERRGPGAAGRPGGERPADRPGQPPRLLRAAARRGRAGPPPRAPPQPGGHRPGPLQAGQRHPRPPGRRPRARGGRRAPRRARRARRTRWPGSAARSSPGCCPRATRTRPGPPPSGPGGPSPRRPSRKVGPHDHVGRNRRAGDRRERQRALSRRRRRPLLGQGPGARRLRALRPRARAGDGRPPRGCLGAPGPERRAPAGPGPRAARADARRGGASSRGQGGVALPGRRRRRLRAAPRRGVPLEETYCQRVVEGALPNLVRDARRDERVRDLPITTEAGIGAYAGCRSRSPAGSSTACCAA